jgi:hypothetical protein
MLYTHTLLVVVVKRDERRRHLLQMIRFEMRRFYNGRYSPFIACGRLQSWPSKKSFPSCQPNSTLIRSSSSLVSQPGSIDLNLLYIPQHRRAIYFLFLYFFLQRKDRELYNILRVDGPRANPLGPVCETGKKRKGSRAKPYR